ncbi:MAG: YigZ family protein [Tidjanibacter sp.]|nr:YigZ family protein [Tidjanibacter sp.]
MEDDSYKTIATAAETTFRERSSRFSGFAFPIGSEQEVKQIVDELRKRFYDATHHCYAYRLGPRGEQFRSSDDGEPSGTAGRPILGQLLSRQVTDCLVVVVRWFGGTKLGVPGLIAAYRQSAADAIEAGGVVERFIERKISIRFPYESMNGVQKAIKELSPAISAQEFDIVCRMTLSIRESLADRLVKMLSEVEGLTTE